MIKKLFGSWIFKNVDTSKKNRLLKTISGEETIVINGPIERTLKVSNKDEKIIIN
jgi:hypothetical protein